ncbi:MAG TPA: hypothetical protein VF530_16350 [Planctomycetota bacterium]
MGDAADARGGRWAPWLVLALLAAQNAWMLAGHYSGEVLFPWDFAKTYHAVPFFWTTAVGAGTFPTWVPFQGVGYPLAMNVQSGLFYPPLWFFPALGLTYSLHAAVVFQCLHVLLGAFGMSVLARRRGLAWRYAALAGAAFQVFGGFFSNAQHPDIVRGFAWTPWLLAALTLGPGERGLGPLRARLLPLVVLAFLTGAYPGQGPAALLLGGLYLAAQLVDFDPRPRFLRGNLRPVLVRGAWLELGVGLALVHLLPAWLLRDELLRASEAGDLERTGLGPWHAFTAIFPYDAPFLEGDLSMRSLFVTVPVLVGLFLLRARDLRAELASIVLLLVAAALIQAGAVHRLAIALLPPLGLSRFPAADYRALVAVPAILLGMCGLRSALERGLGAWDTLPRALLLGAFLWAGFARFGPKGLTPEQVRALALVLAASVLVLAFGSWRGLGARYGALALLVVVLADGRRLHQAVRRPWSPEVPGREARQLGDFEAMRAELEAELSRARVERPARSEQETFDGYRRGAYVFHDYAASDHLAVVARLMQRRPLARHVKRASTPLLLAEETELDPVHAALEQPLDPALGKVACESFAPAELRYAVSTSVPALLVENEPAFPGWSARRADTGAALEPVPQAWPLRAWRVPPGEYALTLSFRMPGLRLAGAASLAAALLWLGLLVYGLRRRPHSSSPA